MHAAPAPRPVKNLRAAPTARLYKLLVTRSGRESAVIISLREYESLKETAYLMASPANARRLNEAATGRRSGSGRPRSRRRPW
ncbi:type II toxin-antitoxin system Phd/YefM family antitoxin [Micromonospora sp. NPDC000442]|uniref:type II toxin-antitoxin system Phd/YefM family antitoxin n=1 Tax=Micromonospora sp. NPDC000442 TaxID=3364217 RepID=UPI0036A1CBC5